MTSQELNHIIQGCLANDRNCEKALYNYLLPDLMRIGRRYLKNTEDIKDLVQESMLKIFSNLSTFKGESAITTWANRVMINLTLYNLSKGNLKKKITQETELISNFDVSSDDHIHMEGKLQAEDLVRFIERLPEGKKVIFNLYVIDGYSHKEIAEMLNINESTSKAQLSKAKEILIKMHKHYNLKASAKAY